MTQIDINCLAGHWPFRYIRKNTVAELLEVHRHNGFSLGIVGSLDSVFYNDPMEGDKLLAQDLEGTGYRLAATINPTLPSFVQDWQYAKEKLHAAAARVYPTYHNYDLDHPDFLRLCRLLNEERVPLLLCLRLEDARLEYLICQKKLSLSLVKDIADAFPQMPIVLLNIYGQELKELGERAWDYLNLYIDTSGLKNNLFDLEKIVRTVGAKKIVFGSQWPLNCFASTALKVQDVGVSQEEKNCIYSQALAWTE